MNEELGDELSRKGIYIEVEPYDDRKPSPYDGYGEFVHQITGGLPKEGAVPEKPKEVTVEFTLNEITGKPERK